MDPTSKGKWFHHDEGVRHRLGYDTDLGPWVRPAVPASTELASAAVGYSSTLGVVSDFELRELRRAAKEGDPLDPEAVVRAVDALTELRQRIGTPTELHLSALVDADHPDRWRVTHPLLRTEPSADDAADALILAAAELRERFTNRSDGHRDPADWRFRRVAHAEWDALAGGDTREAAALRSALAHIAHTETQLAEERDRAWDRRVVGGSGSRVAREQTRARLRARSLERLEACNVEGVERTWSSYGFGSLDDIGSPA